MNDLKATERDFYKKEATIGTYEVFECTEWEICNCCKKATPTKNSGERLLKIVYLCQLSEIVKEMERRMTRSFIL